MLLVSIKSGYSLTGPTRSFAYVYSAKNKIIVTIIESILQKQQLLLILHPPFAIH